MPRSIASILEMTGRECPCLGAFRLVLLLPTVAVLLRLIARRLHMMPECPVTPDRVLLDVITVRQL
jgi:hypothetical protein